jgi:hypothetical protein
VPVWRHTIRSPAGRGVCGAGGLSMRTWALAVAALTLVALTSPIAAGDKRSSALAVRVTVVRPCSVNTDAARQANPVTCGSRFGPPVMSTSSTITLAVPTAPAARVDTAALNSTALNSTALNTAAPPREPSRDPSDAPAARQADASVERVVDASVVLPADDAAAESADPASAAAPATVAIRVVTVNF